MTRIKARERNTIRRALQAGVVPRLGLPHLQVGRAKETEAIINDVDSISAGSASVRFLIGEYGSGKTFLLTLARLIALEKGLVVASADLAPDRRLQASDGKARSLYAELTRNIATRTKPSGGAMSSIVERFANRAEREADTSNKQTDEIIRSKLADLEELTGGYDFARVIGKYWLAFKEGNDELKNSVLRWLRGEYSTKTEARKDLGVRTIVDDQSVYDHLKLLAMFVRVAGYQGLLVSLDEMVNIYKLVNSQARSSNYEQLLRIINDVLQGNTSYVGFMFGGTPEFLNDQRRGVYSYEALKSRLTDNTFAQGGLVDMTGPVIRLNNLVREELYTLLVNIRRVIQGEQPTLPDQALQAFMDHCSRRIGDAYFRTPRNTVKEFVNLLAVLEQNPDADWQQLLGEVKIEDDRGDDLSDIKDDDELSSFKL